MASASVAAIGTILKRGDGTAQAAKTIASSPTGAVENAGRTQATITTTVAHGYLVGDNIIIAGVTNALFNGTFDVVSVTSTTFVVNNAAPAASATSGSGTATDTDTTFSTVAEALEINGPEDALEHIDVTNMDSPSFFMEILPTIIKAGILVCEFNYIPQNTVQKNVLVDYAARTLRNWKIQFSDAQPTIVAFAAYVTKWHPIAKVKDQLKLQIELTLSANVTFAP
jgi:hypothetical protein